MSSTSRASREVMMRGLPRSKGFGHGGDEPTATMACSKLDELLPFIGFDPQRGNLRSNRGRS
jgi:hypothetical protein